MPLGPHIGKELELMLAGEKKLSVFGSFIDESGGIDLRAVPEQDFAPHVAEGRLIRIEKKMEHEGRPYIGVCYTLPGEEWRGHFYMWYKDALYSGNHTYHQNDEYILANLLGYSEQDVRELYISFTTP